MEYNLCIVRQQALLSWTRTTLIVLSHVSHNLPYRDKYCQIFALRTTLSQLNNTLYLLSFSIVRNICACMQNYSCVQNFNGHAQFYRNAITNFNGPIYTFCTGAITAVIALLTLILCRRTGAKHKHNVPSDYIPPIYSETYHTIMPCLLGQVS